MKSAFHGGNTENVTESILVAKVARLTDDGSTVGPGSYNVARAYKANSPSAKGADWSINKTRRVDHFVRNGTEAEVGPGAYHISKYVDRSIKNPTIPRQEKPNTWGPGRGKRARNGGSIRADYETDSDTEGRERYSPGPGQYLSGNQASTFKRHTEFVHDHPEKFGSVATRFKDNNTMAHVGPGSYLS